MGPDSPFGAGDPWGCPDHHLDAGQRKKLEDNSFCFTNNKNLTAKVAPEKSVAATQELEVILKGQVSVELCPGKCLTLEQRKQLCFGLRDGLLPTGQPLSGLKGPNAGTDPKTGEPAQAIREVWEQHLHRSRQRILQFWRKHKPKITELSLENKTLDDFPEKKKDDIFWRDPSNPLGIGPFNNKLDHWETQHDKKINDKFKAEKGVGQETKLTARVLELDKLWAENAHAPAQNSFVVWQMGTRRQSQKRSGRNCLSCHGRRCYNCNHTFVP